MRRRLRRTKIRGVRKTERRARLAGHGEWSKQLLSAMAVVGLGLATACSGSDSGGPPIDMSGSYSVAVTNGPNGCEFPNWRENESSQNIPFNITQSGADATGTVEGLTGAFV